MRITYKTDQKTQLIEAIKANDEIALKSLYDNNYFKVEAFILKNNGSHEHAKDIFQDAFLAVWKNIKHNKFIPENKSSINGYLYTIAKNKWMDYLRSNNYKKTVISDQINNYKDSEIDHSLDNDDILKEERLSYVMQAFKDLGEPCKSLLRQFYFDKKSMKEIANELQIDAASTRNKKYRCMQQLRKIALKIDK